jgi:acetoin utilization deacetylase AcuC-like enzyme
LQLFYTDIFELPLPPEHRFPMAKYRLLRERLLAEGTVPPESLEIPDPATDRELLRVHSPAYLERVVTGTLDRAAVRRMGFPWSARLVERSRRSAGATLAACRAALVDGVAVNLAGGTHHAFADRGEGYCVFNDAAVAARAMQAEGRVERIMIVDCDVHQGDGTAAIFHADPTVITMSIHGQSNYPFRKQASDIDVPLPDNTGDSEYLKALDVALARALHQAAPDLAIYVAGADPYRGDRLGRLALTKRGLRTRDRSVFEALAARGVPVAVVMAGGYAEVDDVVDIHAATVAAALESFATRGNAPVTLR